MKKKKKVTKKLDEVYYRLLEEKIDIHGYAYGVSPDVFIELMKEVMIGFDILQRTPTYRGLPIYIDNSLLKGTIFVFKKID